MKLWVLCVGLGEETTHAIRRRAPSQARGGDTVAAPVRLALILFLFS